MAVDMRTAPEQKGRGEDVLMDRNCSLFSQGPEPWEVTFPVGNKEVMNYGRD